MPIVYLVLAIAAVFVVATLLVGVVAGAIVGLVVGSVALLAVLIDVLAFRSALRAGRGPAWLAGTVKVDGQQSRVVLQLDENLFGNAIGARLAVFAWCAAIAAVFAVLAHGWSEAKVTSSDEQALLWSALLAACGSAGLLSWHATVFLGTRLWKGVVSAELRARVDDAAGRAGEGLPDIARLLSRYESLRHRFGVPMPSLRRQEVDYELREAAAVCFRNVAEFRKRLARIGERLMHDIAELGEALSAFERARSAAESARKAVRATGSRELLRELDSLAARLEPSAIEPHLRAERWASLASELRTIESALSRLRDDAGRFRAAAGSGTRREQDWGAMSAPEAFDSLGLPRTARPEQIKTVYRALAQAWHSDGGAGDHERMALINRAYETLRKHGYLDPTPE